MSLSSNGVVALVTVQTNDAPGARAGLEHRAKLVFVALGLHELAVADAARQPIVQREPQRSSAHPSPRSAN